MDDALSPLAEANRRLHALQAQARVNRGGRRENDSPNTGSHASVPARQSSQISAALIEALPPHLGWASAAFTRALQAAKSPGANHYQPPFPIHEPAHTCGLSPATRQSHQATVKVYPDIALGMLRQEQAAAGRLWLLLRHLDGAGRGWLRIDIIKQTTTKKQNNLYLCGWRQLRNLFRQGEGLFWRRDKERLWLRSAARVAAGLGVARLTGRPVALPVRILLEGMGMVRAHLYASFHGGRVKEAVRGQGRKPIARATLQRLSGVTPQGQRVYEERAGIGVQSNYAVGERSAPERRQRRAWEKGGALFEFIDHQGHQGRKGGAYLAWQLPNSYQCEQPQRPKGQQKRINRKLADLFMKGMTGNDGETMGKRYFDSPAQAARAHGKEPAGERFWRQQITRRSGGCMWQVIDRGV